MANLEHVDAIVYSNNDPLALSTIATIAKQSYESGRTPIIHDLTSVLYGSPDTFAPQILRMVRKRTPEQIFKQWIVENNFQYFSISGVSYDTDSIESNEQLRENLNESIFSALLTFTRHHNPAMNRRSVRNAQRGLRTEGEATFDYFDREFSKYSSDLRVFIPNGRFPHQRMAVEAARKNNAVINYFERGEEPGTYFLQEYTTQDRLQTQTHASKLTDEMSRLEVENLAKNWMQKRSGKSSTNEYGVVWDHHDSEFDLGSNPLGIFTSSQDEFLHLGPEYQHHSWRDQFEAIECVVQLAYKRGYSPFVRIHPNLTNKSHSFYRSELRSISRLKSTFPELPIFMHDSKLSTYRLLEQCKCCFVWDSTVGLEASAIGIPVHTLAMSRYGEISDIRQIFGPEILHDLELEWNVDRYGAMRYMAYLMRRDFIVEVETQMWKDWEGDREPLSVKLSRLVFSGGAPNLRQSLISTLDSYRHRNISAKIAAFKKSIIFRTK